MSVSPTVTELIELLGAALVEYDTVPDADEDDQIEPGVYFEYKDEDGNLRLACLSGARIDEDGDVRLETHLKVHES